MLSDVLCCEVLHGFQYVSCCETFHGVRYVRGVMCHSVRHILQVRIALTEDSVPM